MSIFIGNLIGFAVIVFIIVRWVVPPVKELMRKRQESVRTALKESAEAAKKLADADARHAKAVEDAKKISERVADEARQDSKSIAEQLAAQADVEAERIRNQGAQQVQLMRAQAIRALRCKLGEDAVAKADELVRSHVSDDEARSATVDHFLDQLDDMAPSSFKFETSAHARLRATSRAAIDAVTTEFDDVVGRLGASGLTELAADLASVARLLLAEPVLRRHLAESSDEPEAKARLVDTLLSGKVGDHTLKLLQTAAAQRWSDEMDLVEGIEHAARLALLKRADANDEVDEVEEQLFRLGRILDAQPRLNSLLTDYTRPADGRLELLNKVLDDGAMNETAKLLLEQTVGLLRGEHADEAVVDLAELAVSRRGEIVAHVTAAAEPSDEQRTRLADVLGRIYEHPVSVQLNVDAELLGGLSITVGDEVIDGSIASRLAAALTQLPD